MINKKKLGIGFLNIFIYIFLTSILTEILGSFNIKLGIITLNFYLLIPPLIVLIILIIMNKDLFKGKWQDLNNNKTNYIKLAIKYYVCGLLLMFISNTIISLFESGLPQNEVQNRALIKVLPIYSIINMVILAPLCEELSFRGSFKESIKDKNLFLIFTSLIFGLMHVIFNGDYIKFIPYAALGYFFGKTYYETDNILISFIQHAFHNGLSILLIFLSGGLV